tara:strand:- start:690 stop:944 length:255 start_codon:yes stop_codon:yes gene_type:complete
MKFFKTILIIGSSFIFLIGLWLAVTAILTEIYPPYVILENGRRGYVMNTGNFILGFVLSVITTAVLFVFLQARINKFINRSAES